VVSVTEEGIIMQANGGRILIKRLRPLGGDKQPAAAWYQG
jgi:methionyl-tRNA formyltransferase